MKKLGVISHISKKGKIILRSDKTPAFAQHVFTPDKKKVGFVHDIFGPTKEPFISVKIHTKYSKNLENRVGEILYVQSKPTKKWGRRKRRKK